MSEKKQDNRTIVRKFIENHAEEYNLSIYHVSILRVIAEYCDMTLKYCCLSYKKLEEYSRMSEPQRKKVLAYLKKYKIIEQTFIKGKPIHTIGDAVFKKNMDIELSTDDGFHVTNHIPYLSH